MAAGIVYLGYFSLQFIFPSLYSSVNNNLLPWAFEFYYNYMETGELTTESSDQLHDSHYYDLPDKTLFHGDGKYTRDWLWVGDHATAIDTVFHKGKNGETYNIGGNNEWQNIDLVRILCDTVDGLLGRSADNGVTWDILTDGIGIRENYTLGVSQSNHFLTRC